jgi:hypothetical protein
MKQRKTIKSKNSSNHSLYGTEINYSLFSDQAAHKIKWNLGTFEK